jgi:hypothetical protein
MTTFSGCAGQNLEEERERQVGTEGIQSPEKLVMCKQKENLDLNL